MGRWRRLTREGNKLLVCAEKTQSTHGTLWSEPRFLAIHPKYKKIVTPNGGGYNVIIGDSASFSLEITSVPDPVTEQRKKQIWGGFYGNVYIGEATGTLHYTTSADVEEGGGWTREYSGDSGKYNSSGYAVETASSNGTYHFSNGEIVPDIIESEAGKWVYLADELDDSARAQRQKHATSQWGYPNGNNWYYHSGNPKPTFVPYYTSYYFGGRFKVKVTRKYDAISWSDGTSSPAEEGFLHVDMAGGVEIRLHSKPGETPWLEVVNDSRRVFVETAYGTIGGIVNGQPSVSLEYFGGGETVTYEDVDDDDFPPGVDYKKTA